MSERKLTPKQERFVEEYLIDLNASAAARRAGYSEKTAGAIGQQLIAKTSIQEAIAAKRSERSERTGITAADVVQMIQRQYEINATCYQKIDFPHGRPVLLQVDATAANKALDMLMKHVGGYERDNRRELSGGINLSWGGDDGD